MKVGSIVKTLTDDCRAKASLIRDTIPRVVFNVDRDMDVAGAKLLDSWTYTEP